MDYWAKDIYSWGIFSAEVYPRSSIAIEKTVRMPWISCPSHIFWQVTWTLRTTSSGVAHPLSIFCKGHYTLWSALPGLPSPNMASLDHSGSRTTTSGLWQSTPSDMSMCLTSSGQHLVNGEGSSGFSGGSSRMVPPPTPQTNHWHGNSSVSLTDWSAAGVTRSGRRIHRTWTPQIFICGGTLSQGEWQQPTDYPWPDGSNHSSNTSDPKGGMREGHRELCPRGPNRELCPRLQRREAHSEYIFWASVKQRVFVVQTWNSWNVCYKDLS